MTTMDNVAAQLESLKMQLGDLESSLRVNQQFGTSQIVAGYAKTNYVMTNHANALGTPLAAAGVAISAITGWPHQYDICYIPFYLLSPASFFAPLIPGATITTWYSAVYDADTGVRLMAGNQSDHGILTTLGPGRYYMAVKVDDTPGTPAFYGWSFSGGAISSNVAGASWSNGVAGALPANIDQSVLYKTTLTVPLIAMAHQPGIEYPLPFG